MNKAELVAHVAEQANITKKSADAVLTSLIGAIHQSLKESGTIRIDGLGTFRVLDRKARTGVNPITREKMDIPAMKVPGFKAAKALKEVVKPPEVKEPEKKPETKPEVKPEKKPDKKKK